MPTESQQPEHNSSTSTQGVSSRLSDSPWFWLYIFTVFGLILLIITLPKLEQRQLELQREGKAKRQALQRQSPDRATPAEKLARESELNSAIERQASSLGHIRSIIVVLSLILVAAWIVFILQRYRSLPSSQMTADKSTSN